MVHLRDSTGDREEPIAGLSQTIQSRREAGGRAALLPPPHRAHIHMNEGMAAIVANATAMQFQGGIP